VGAIGPRSRPADVDASHPGGATVTVSDTTPLADLEAVTKTIRRDIINSTTAAGSGHPTSSLSAVELTVPLYFAGILRYDPKNPTWPERDRFILSKGHAAPLLYALLAEAGYFPTDMLPNLRKLGSPLEGHPNMRRLAGVEASTGSLGQGLSLGVGMALAARLDGRDSRVYVLLGDGEVEEGQVWEAAMSANKFHLDNLVAVVDQNGYQQTGSTSKVMNLRPLAEKFEAFGWFVQEIDGHDLGAVIGAYATAKATKGRPSAIVAYTKKGYPIMDVVHDPNHHGKPLSKDEAAKAIAYIDSYDPQLQRDKDKD
jgi:transketolase